MQSVKFNWCNKDQAVFYPKQEPAGLNSSQAVLVRNTIYPPSNHASHFGYLTRKKVEQIVFRVFAYQFDKDMLNPKYSDVLFCEIPLHQNSDDTTE